MLNYKRISILFMLIVGLPMLGACTPKSDVKTASINQILGNQNTLQERAFYHFEKGSLTVSIDYATLQTPTEAAKDPQDNEIIQGDLARYNKEFPKANITFEDLENRFEKEFKNVTFKIDEEKGELSLTGDGIHKVFQIFETNEKRLVDEAKIEYELLE